MNSKKEMLREQRLFLHLKIQMMAKVFIMPIMEERNILLKAQRFML